MKRNCGTLLALLVLIIAPAAHAQPEGTEGHDEPESEYEDSDEYGEAAPAAEEAPDVPESPAVAEAPAEAPEADDGGPGIVLTGSFFTRHELRHNYNRIDPPRVGPRFGEMDTTFYRARIGLASTPIDVGEGRSVIISAVPQAAGFWGPSGGLADADVGLHEAKLRIAGATNWLDLGRFEMIYADHLVIGNVGWHEVGRSFDGGRLHLGIGDKGAWLDTFVTMITEGASLGVTGFGDGDIYFAGAYAGLGPHFGDLDLDAYLLTHIAPETPGLQDSTTVEVTLGSRIQKKIETLILRAEAGLQLGERPLAPDVSVFAFHIDGDVTVEASEQMKLIAGGQYASGDDPDSEDNEAWNQLYPTAHKFLGFMDIIGGRSNIMSAFGKARYQQSPKLGLAADLHFFLRPQTPDGVDSYTGIEADLWALYKLGKGLGLRTQYAAFVPNEDGPLGADRLIHYVEIQLKYDLK